MPATLNLPGARSARVNSANLALIWRAGWTLPRFRSTVLAP